MAKKPEIICEIINDVRRIFQVVHEHSKRAKRETGLTGAQLWAIKTIAEEKEAKVSDLARRMYLHPATVVGILNRLEKMNLVERNRKDADRRIVRVTLTDRGQAIVKGSPAVAQGMLASGLEPLTVKRLQNLAEGLSDLVRILGAEELPPRLILSTELNVPEPRKIESQA
jgi:DNA-binding MarR family transcriptional regulator